MAENFDPVLGGRAAGGFDPVMGGLVAIKQALASPDPQVRIRALQDAIQYGSEGAALVMERQDKDPDWQVRTLAKEILLSSTRDSAKGENLDPVLGGRAPGGFDPVMGGLVAIKQALASPDPQVRIRALQDALYSGSEGAALVMERLEKDSDSQIRITAKQILMGSGGDLARKAEKIKINYAIDLGKGIQIEMVEIPSGSFDMGSNDDPSEQPIHRVSLQGFWMGKYPITQGQYQAVMGHNPSKFTGDLNRPVEQVSWNDATAFCQKLSRMSGQKVSLPSEAQWEYACRAGTTTRYFFGDDDDDYDEYDNDNDYFDNAEAQLGQYAWFRDNSNKQTHPVGQKKPNAWGLYDMHGNVWERCQDPWHENYKARTNGSVLWWSGGDTQYTVLRGGSWLYYPENCRSASRLRLSPDDRSSDIGFRVVSV